MNTIRWSPLGLERGGHPSARPVQGEPLMRPRHALLAAVTIAALYLAGCSGAGSPATPATTTTPPAPDNGISALAPADILTKSLAAVTSAGSVHLTGQVSSDTVDVLASGGNLQLTTSGPDGNLD